MAWSFRVALSVHQRPACPLGRLGFFASSWQIWRHEWHHMRNLVGAPTYSAFCVKAMRATTLLPFILRHDGALKTRPRYPERMAVLPSFDFVQQGWGDCHPGSNWQQSLYFIGMGCLLFAFGVLPLEVAAHAVAKR